MGRRGRNRKGYYLALLYALELLYEEQRRRKGSDPTRWTPSPHNRPDQFCFWTIDALRTLHAAEPRDFGRLLAALERHRLPHVATLLEHVAVDRPDPPELAPVFAEARRGERHPQARKFALVVRRQLDRRWLAALRVVAREYASMEELPAAALLLGGLPPAFHVLNERIFHPLEDAEAIREHRSLTALQFYALATGALPSAPEPWPATLDELEPLGRDELERLGSLSDPQLADLRAAARGAAAPEAIDPEVARLLRRREIGAATLDRLAAWSDERLAAVRALLGDRTHRTWVTAYLEDRRALEAIFATRTGAHLDLRELFPETVAWLDDHLGRCLEEALRLDVGDLEARATIISRRIRQQLWLEPGAPDAPPPLRA